MLWLMTYRPGISAATVATLEQAQAGMDTTAQFDTVIDLLGRLGVDIRQEHLGGACGGLCEVHGRRVVFVDLDADAATRLEWCVRALASLPELDLVYVTPALRDLIEGVRDS